METRGRPKAELVLSDDERVQLTSYARSRSLPRSLSERARIVLSSAEGEANSSIAERLKLSKATVGKWRARFIERRIAGLYDDVRPGAPRTIDDERMAELINTTLHTKPADGSTHWSVRTVAAETAYLQEQRAALLPALWPAAASHRELQAVQRSVLRREAARRGRLVPEPARQRAGPVRGREEPVPGAGAHAADAADGTWATSKASPTTTSAMARPRCLPR